MNININYKNYEQMPIEVFVRLTKVTADLTPIKSNIHLLSECTGMSIEEVEKLDVNVYLAVLNELDFTQSLFETCTQFEFEGEVWKVDNTPSILSVAQWMNYEDIQMKYQGVDRIIPSVTLLLYQGNDSEYVYQNRWANLERVKRMPTSIIMGIANFFLERLQLLENLTRLSTHLKEVQTQHSLEQNKV